LLCFKGILGGIVGRSNRHVLVVGTLLLVIAHEVYAIPQFGASGSCYAQAALYQDGDCDYQSGDPQSGYSAGAESEYWQNETLQALAYSSWQARAGYGDIGVRVTASASVHDQYFAEATGFAQGWFFDSFTLVSNGAPLGAPVTVLATHVVTHTPSLSKTVQSTNGYTSKVDLSGSISGSLQVQVDWFGAISSYEDRYAAGYQSEVSGEDEAKYRNSLLLHTWVGATITHSYTMEAQCHVYVEQPTQNIPDSTDARCHADASGSGHVYYDLLTPGVLLVSESGTDYRSPIVAAPEPDSIALVGIGLAGIGLMRRRSAC